MRWRYKEYVASVFSLLFTPCFWCRIVNIRYSSRQSWHSCVVNTCVYFNFCRVTQSEHACDTKWAAHESTFVYCMSAIFRACMRVTNTSYTIDSKKHASNALCAACKSVFLCAVYKLAYIFCQRRIKAYNKIRGMLAEDDRTMDMKKIMFCQVFMPPIPIPSGWHCIEPTEYQTQ